MKNHKEELTIYEECKVMVLLEMKLKYLKETINSTTDDFLAELLTIDVEELTEIHKKLKG